MNQILYVDKLYYLALKGSNNDIIGVKLTAKHRIRVGDRWWRFGNSTSFHIFIRK